MYEIIRKLITDPFFAFIAVIVLWLVLYVILVKVGKLKKVTWARLEYIWIRIYSSWIQQYLY